MEYIPSQGDVIYIDFDPVVGSEQGGHRSAVVLSNWRHNKTIKLAIVVPTTTQVKGYYTEMKIPDGYKTTGVILTNHIKTLAWPYRHINYVETLDKNLVKEIVRRVGYLLKVD